MEHWCPIENYPHYYISTYGRVFSDKHKKIMKPIICRNGYLRIGLSKNNIKKLYSISRLVAQHFLKGKGEVDHIDRNKLNNYIDNLRWVSSSENQQNKNKSKNIKYSSKYKGVYLFRNKWHVQCGINNKKKYIGSFDNEEDAGRAYDQFCIEQGLTTALLNFPI